MEKESNIGTILSEFEVAKRKTVEALKVLLQQQTQEVVKKGLFEGPKPKSFDDVDLDFEEPFLYAGLLETAQSDVGYRAEHVVLRRDGKLYQLEVFGEPDEEGDWEYEGKLLGEINDEDYLNITPRVIEGVEELISGATEEH